jgi:TolB-like protein/Flp pilus assembly protein TadD
MDQPGHAFGEFVLDPGSGTLFRQGSPVPVPYRALLLLMALVQRAGMVASKAELLEAAWPGMAVEEGNLSAQIAALRRTLGSQLDGSDYIVTVPRVGYRFAAAVSHAPESGGGIATPQLPDRPSLAVLPFANLSDDPEQQFFADGLAEDIITRLAGLRWLFLSARNSSFTYQAKAVDIKRVGAELGVRYVLGGSVRRSGNRLRVATLLSDAMTGAQVWAERFDAELKDFFDLQDEIANGVMAALEPQIYAAEHDRLRSRKPENLDAWGYLMRAMPLVWTWGSAEEIRTARGLLEQALALDATYGRARSLLAWTFAADAHLGQEDPNSALSNALALAQQAVQSDPHDAWTRFAAGYVHMVSRNFNSAIEELTAALTLNQSFALAHTLVGSTYAYNGMAEEGINHLLLAQRLSPRDYNEAANHSTMGLCHMMAGRFSEAASHQRRAVQLRPHFVTAWRTLAATAGLAGDLDNARQALQVSRRLQPALSLQWVMQYHPIVQEEHRKLYCRGLQAAGLD